MRFKRGGMAFRLAAGTAVMVMVVGGCGSATTPSAGATAPASVAPPASASGGGSPSAPAGEINLFDTAYEPASGSDGGQAIIGDWQEATQFNPYYFTQVTEGNVVSATWATLATFTDDYKYAPDLAKEIPTLDNGGVKVPVTVATR